MLRLAFVLLLLVAAPAQAQDAVDRALRCVHAAMTSLHPVGGAAEQRAAIALARCFDEIEAVVSTATVADAARIALRRELLDYAVYVTGGAAAFDETAAIADLPRPW